MISTAQWVPILTSEAGLTLTTRNWQDAKVHAGVFYLDTLLLKPGLTLLKEITDFSVYMNWPGPVILNASRLNANKEGVITLVSPFDGSKIRIDYEVLIDLINHLTPQMVILPGNITQQFPQIWDNWNKNIVPYLSSKDLELTTPSLTHGVYFTTDDALDVQIERYKQLSNYLLASLNRDLITQLALRVDFIESDEPSQMALRGLVFVEGQVLDLKNEQYSLDFDMMGDKCACPTCSAKLTKAYLHHLYQHTPLLCQRFLIQHNAWQISSL